MKTGIGEGGYAEGDRYYDDILEVTSANRWGNRLTGNDLDNILRGDDNGGNVLRGEGGNDILITDGRGSFRHGRDELYRGDGDDFLDGGHGTNHYWGGAGNDIFFIGLHDRFSSGNIERFGYLEIRDLVLGEDKIQLADYYSHISYQAWQGNTSIYFRHENHGSGVPDDDHFSLTLATTIHGFTGTLTSDDFVDLGDVGLTAL